MRAAAGHDLELVAAHQRIAGLGPLPQARLRDDWAGDDEALTPSSGPHLRAQRVSVVRLAVARTLHMYTGAGPAQLTCHLKPGQPACAFRSLEGRETLPLTRKAVLDGKRWTGRVTAAPPSASEGQAHPLERPLEFLAPHD